MYLLCWYLRFIIVLIYVEFYLGQYDNTLCKLLEDRGIQSHLYGMKWTRLLFGREFTMANNLCFKVWDFIIAYNFQIKKPKAETPLSALLETSNVNITEETILSKSRYGPYSAILAGISDIMLAMILQVVFVSWYTLYLWL